MLGFHSVSGFIVFYRSLLPAQAGGEVVGELSIPTSERYHIGKRLYVSNRHILLKAGRAAYHSSWQNLIDVNTKISAYFGINSLLLPHLFGQVPLFPFVSMRNG
ncbi:hypothetical protein BN2497_7777 [Janthinobacterium sp. CG23_2]|nr:hypothetical protein BN2497_7777 [Janthinobacterium sp. CG23_2]CUU30286.1 hypothetical protein BN3177_7777 [Janthinobacterium sp. CG23_2]